jgi:hypothetical protein
MASPIKQENLPAMEDCRLLLKNAVNIKLKASLQHFYDAMALVDASCFLGICLSVCQGLNHQGASEASKIISPKLSRFLLQFSTWATCLLD